MNNNLFIKGKHFISKMFFLISVLQVYLLWDYCAEFWFGFEDDFFIVSFVCIIYTK